MRGVWQWIETWLGSVLHGAATALGQRLVDALLERVDELALEPGYRFDTHPVPWALGPPRLPVNVRLAAR